MDAAAAAAPGVSEEIELTEEQRSAVALAAGTRRLVVVTGGPGTGKTATLRAVWKALEASGKPYVFLAPTGTAGQRVVDALGCGRNVYTVERLLVQPSIASTVMSPAAKVVVDEASMLSLEKFMELHRLLGASYVLVGDPDQLPPVAETPFLETLLAEAAGLPLVRLTRVFRQTESALLRNIGRIRAAAGPMSRLDFEVDDSFRFWDGAPELLVDSRGDAAADQAAKRQRRAEAEAPPLFLTLTNATRAALCARLQRRLNPLGEVVQPACVQAGVREAEVRVGDPIICLENLTTGSGPAARVAVANGNLGRMEREPNGVYVARYDVVDENGRRSKYSDFIDTRDPCNHKFKTRFACAYAVTGNKAQGAGVPRVVVVLEAGALATRRWFYTAVSRASESAVVCGAGDHRVLQRATQPHPPCDNEFSRGLAAVDYSDFDMDAP